MKYKVGDKVYLTPEWEVVEVDSIDNELPYKVKMCGDSEYLWIRERYLSLSEPQKVELTETSPVTDNVNKPNHYYGKYDLEVNEVHRNFIGDLVGMSAAWWYNVVKYVLRFQKKNGIEDLKKARKNLDWLIEEMEDNND